MSKEENNQCDLDYELKLSIEMIRLLHMYTYIMYMYQGFIQGKMGMNNYMEQYIHLHCTHNYNGTCTYIMNFTDLITYSVFVASVRIVFCQKVPQNVNSSPPNCAHLILQCILHLSEQDTHQKMSSAKLVGQRELHFSS